MSNTQPADDSRSEKQASPIPHALPPATESATGSAGESDAHASPAVRIRSLLPGLARAEQRVARVVLADPSTVAQRSIPEVAQAARTSETTVTRFCKATGFPGYPALRIAFAADTARTATRDGAGAGSAVEPDDDAAALLDKIGSADTSAIENTVRQLNTTTLADSVSALATAGRVDIYGLGGSALVAADLQQKLRRIGSLALASSDAHVMLSSAALLGSGDAALAISHTGCSAATVDALRVAAGRGATTIAITNFANAPIGRVSDHLLTTATRETALRSGDTASRTAALTISDCLFVGIARREMTESCSALRRGTQVLRPHRLPTRHDGRRNNTPLPD